MTLEDALLLARHNRTTDGIAIKVLIHVHGHLDAQEVAGECERRLIERDWSPAVATYAAAASQPRTGPGAGPGEAKLGLDAARRRAVDDERDLAGAGASGQSRFLDR